VVGGWAGELPGGWVGCRVGDAWQLVPPADVEYTTAWGVGEGLVHDCNRSGAVWQTCMFPLLLLPPPSRLPSQPEVCMAALDELSV
jgi:hypothetical protein